MRQLALARSAGAGQLALALALLAISLLAGVQSSVPSAWPFQSLPAMRNEPEPPPPPKAYRPPSDADLQKSKLPSCYPDVEHPI